MGKSNLFTKLNLKKKIRQKLMFGKECKSINYRIFMLLKNKIYQLVVIFFETKK